MSTAAGPTIAQPTIAQPTIAQPTGDASTTAAPAPTSGAGLVDERLVRAAAGLTLALGTVAFFEALLGHDYRLLRATTVVLALDFLVRLVAGPSRSPVGAVAGLLVRGLPVEPVSLRPKRFAWSLGFTMSTGMALITNAGVTGWVPRSVCLLCLTLMWLEAVLGVCLGCQVHRLLVARGVVAEDPDLVCADGACVRPDSLAAGAAPRPNT